MTTVAARSMTLRVRGHQCGGASHMVVKVDGVQVGSASVSSTSWASHTFPVLLAARSHTVSVAFTNDHYPGTCDRDLLVDKVTLS